MSEPVGHGRLRDRLAQAEAERDEALRREVGLMSEVSALRADVAELRRRIAELIKGTNQ